MSEALSAEHTAELLLWYYEEPRRYRAEGRRRAAPLLDSAVVLKLALGRRVDFRQPALNEPRTLSTLRHAAALYVRFLFFRQDATPYQVLGLAPSASPEAIKESFRLLMHLVHPDRQDERVVWPDSFAALANRAYGILRNQDERVKFDRDAEARAAMARAVNRAATADEASRMPVPLRPRSRVGKRGVFRGAVLPEWLTAGVGGFVRRHPSVTAFSSLIAVAVLSVGAMVWEKEEALIRDVDADSEHASLVRLPKLPWFTAPATSVSAPVASPNAGTSARRSLSVDTKASAAAKSAAPAATVSLASTAAQPREAIAGSAQVPAAAAAPRRDASPNLAPDPSSGASASVRASAVEAVGAAPLPAAASLEAPAAAPMPVVNKVEPPASAARQVAAAEPTPPTTTTAPGPSSGSVVAFPVVTTAAPVPSPPASAVVTTARIDPNMTVAAGAVPPPGTSEIESLFATFVESYERGRVDVFADLFDIEAETNLGRGRTPVRGEYDELFRLSQWRKMQLTRVNWKRVGNRAVAKGEITVKIGWRDGREVEQRLALDIELMRRDGRVVIARMSQQTRP